MKLNSIRATSCIFMLTFLTTLAYPKWEQTNWKQGNSFFELYNHQDITFARIWDRSSGGHVFFTDDEGKNWAQISSADTDIDVLSIVMWDSKILAGTWDGLYGTILNDMSWIKYTPSGIPPETHIWSIKKIDNVLFAGGTGAIYKSTLGNAIVSWTEISSGIPENARITSIVENGETLFAGTEDSGIFISNDNGANWNAINSGLASLNIFNLLAVDSKMFAITLKEGVFILDINDIDLVSDIDKITWKADESGLKKINCILNTNESLFAGTDTNGVYLSNDQDISWVPVNQGLPENIRIWSITECNDMLFAGTTSGIWKMNPQDINNYSITSSAAEGGTISPEGDVIVYEYCSKTFKITPEKGYRISDVIVDGISIGVVSSYTFPSVTENHTISAEFAVAPHTITASAGEGGTISPSGTFSVSTGSQHTFEITPSKGHVVSDVLVDGISVGAVTSYTFSSISSDHTIIASFRTMAVYQINCGGDAALPYSSDQYFSGGMAYSVPGTINRDDVNNPAPEDVYRTERRGDSTYLFPNLKSGVTYRVRLHFSENFFPMPNFRVFDVKINDNTVLSNFDIFNEAGDRLKALVKEFTTNTNVYREIVIEFKSVKYEAGIMGIEIIEE